MGYFDQIISGLWLGTEQTPNHYRQEPTMNTDAYTPQAFINVDIDVKSVSYQDIGNCNQILRR